MPLDNEVIIGTSKDGSKNSDYCIYCYEDGEFTVDCTMEEMIEMSVKNMRKSGMLEQKSKTEEEAKEFMYGLLPR